MKKLSRRRKIWLSRRANRRLAMRVCRRLARRTTNTLGAVKLIAGKRKVLTLHRDKHREYAVLIGDSVEAPGSLRLSSRSWNNTIRFIRRVRGSIDYQTSVTTSSRVDGFRFPIKYVRSYYDFSSINEISITAALILASEYDRAHILRQYNPSAVDIDRWNKGVAWQLNAIGFLELAGVDRRIESTTNIEGIRLLRMRRGGRVDGDIVSNYLNELGIDLFKEDTFLYEALMEAVTNSVQHAYRRLELCAPLTVPYWWIAAAVQRVEGGRRLIVVIYDQGASIPATVGDWKKAGVLLSALKLALPWSEEPKLGDPRYDGETIRLAIEVGRTSTKEAHRGKGLNQIVNALDLCVTGTVNIFSRHGAFSLTKGKAPICETRDEALIGTLIKWDLTL